MNASTHTPFPEIARLPGERKLEGVPHRAAESVFNQPGLPSALELHTETFGLNSAQRGVVIRQHLAGRSDPEDVIAVADGLELSQDLFENADRARHAGFLAIRLREKAQAMDKSPQSTSPDQKDEFYNDDRNRPSYENFSTERRQEIISVAQAEPFRHGEDPSDDPDLKLEVSRLVRQRNCPDDEIIALGYRLAHRYVSPLQSTTEAAATFASIAYAIDRAKIKAVGRKTPTVISNQIIWAVTSEVAHMLPHDDRALADINHVRQNLEATVPIASWLYPKFDMLSSQVNKYKLVDEYIKRYTSGLLGRVRDMSVRASSALGERDYERTTYPAELMAELLRLKRYTVKPAYFNGDILTKDVTESWVLAPSESIMGLGWDGKEARVANPYVAKIDLAPKTNPEDIQGERKEVSYGKNQQIAYLEYADYEPRLILGLYPDGELGLISGGNIRDIRGQFELAGQADLYQTLQMTLIKSLFDLVVPAEIVERLPGVDNGSEKIGIFTRARQSAKSPIRDLVLARIKYIRENADEIQRSIDNENNDESTRHLREHGVVGHVRRLPPGFSPTSEAIALAESLGIKLAPNETFVREHRRGSEENGVVTSHRAVQSRSHIAV